MKVLWLSWKDEHHPQAGGAEKVSSELRRRLVADGHQVKLVTARYTGASQDDIIEGVAIHRTGGRFSVYYHAFRYCKRQLQTWPDVVIDEMNTLPFGACFYYRKIPVYLLAYQLARQVWFYQIALPVALLGYLLEPVMLRVLSIGGYRAAITESQSSKQDMRRYGLKNIHIFRVGIPIAAQRKLNIKRNPKMVLSLGALRPMKRTLHAVKAFEVAHSKDKTLRMKIAGDTQSAYGQKVIRYIQHSASRDAISVLGRVSNEERQQLMQEAALILVTSVKEGWGLIVTEANSQGTPAVVYDVDGLRDSVIANKTGTIVTDKDYAAMGRAINTLASDPSLYSCYRQAAWESSRQYTFENSYTDFAHIISS